MFAWVDTFTDWRQKLEVYSWEFPYLRATRCYAIGGADEVRLDHAFGII